MEKEKNLKEMVSLSPEGIVYFLWLYLTLFMELKKTFRRQKVIIFYKPLGNNCVPTKDLGAGIIVWELRTKNVLNAFGSIQWRYMQLRL